MVVRSSFFLLFLSENRPKSSIITPRERGLQFLKGRALLLFLFFSLSLSRARGRIDRDDLLSCVVVVVVLLLLCLLLNRRC